MASKPKKKSPKTIDFHLIKSNQFRVVRGDGAFGGLTPQGAISASFYSERFPLPRTTTHEIKDGKPGDEIIAKRDVRSGIVREIEVNVVLELAAAIAFHQWLGRKIVELSAAMEKRATDAAAAAANSATKQTKSKPAKSKKTKGKSDDTLH